MALRIVSHRWFRRLLQLCAVLLSIAVAVTSNTSEFAYFILGLLACGAVAVATTLPEQHEDNQPESEAQ